MYVPSLLWLSSPPEVTGACSELKVQKSEEKFGGKEILRIFASAIRETVDENDFRSPVDARKIDILVR